MHTKDLTVELGTNLVQHLVLVRETILLLQLADPSDCLQTREILKRLDAELIKLGGAFGDRLQTHNHELARYRLPQATPTTPAPHPTASEEPPKSLSFPS
jgi:hypothetical protein